MLEIISFKFLISYFHFLLYLFHSNYLITYFISLFDHNSITNIIIIRFISDVNDGIYYFTFDYINQWQ